MSKRNLGIKVIMVALLGLMVGCSGSESSDDWATTAALLAAQESKSNIPASVEDMELGDAALDSAQSGDGAILLGFLASREINSANVEMARQILEGLIPDGLAQEKALELLAFVDECIEKETDLVEGIFDSILGGVALGGDTKSLDAAILVRKLGEGSGIDSEFELPERLSGLSEAVNDFIDKVEGFKLSGDGSLDDDAVDSVIDLAYVLGLVSQIEKGQRDLAWDILDGVLPEGPVRDFAKATLDVAEYGLESVDIPLAWELAAHIENCFKYAQEGDAAKLAGEMNMMADKIMGRNAELARVILLLLAPDEIDPVIVEFMKFVDGSIDASTGFAQQIIDKLAEANAPK